MMPRMCLLKDLDSSVTGKLLLALKVNEKLPRLTYNNNANETSIRLAWSQSLATPCNLLAWRHLTPLNIATL